MRTINRILAVTAAAMALAGATGCAAESGGTPAPLPAAGSPAPASGSAPASEGVVTIRDFAHEVPASVKPGAMLAVTNADKAPHTLTVKDKSGFDVEVPGGGTTIFQAPDTPGEYRIICTFHPGMSAKLVVD